MKKIILFVICITPLMGSQVIFGSSITTKFAVIFDRTGTHEQGKFAKCMNAAKMQGVELNVMVGDLVEGGTGKPSVLENQ